MVNQQVLRGGACVTPPGHTRPTYRNFFPASSRWPYTGLRLAHDDAMSALPVTLDVRLDATAMRAALERDARAGLLATPKTLPPVWFYDDVGSDLFDQITRLDEYYPTRAERRAARGARRRGRRLDLSGDARRARRGDLHQDPDPPRRLRRRGTLRRYVAVDVAEGTLVAATEEIARSTPGSR